MSLKTIEVLPFACSERLLRFWRRNQDKLETEDTQVIGILYGSPGSGKSIRAQEAAEAGKHGQISIKQIAFDKREIVEAILTSRKQVVIADEGISIFFSRAAMTKEGRLMSELMAQCRQKNLHIIICIRDLMEVDNSILKSANYVAYVWESRKEINGRMVTMKGNMRLYPHFKHNSFRDRLIQYLRVRKSNPLIKIKAPKPWLTEAGSPYGEGFKGAFYAVPEADYKAKKEAILAKYHKELQRKPRNNKIDFATMDKLIMAHIPQADIAKHCEASKREVQIRAAMLRSTHKKRTKRAKSRGKGRK